MGKFFKRTVVFILILTLMVSTSVFASFAVNRKVSPVTAKNVNINIRSDGDKVIRLENSDKTRGRVIAESAALPSRYSSADKGYITNIKNQKKTNCCWAFAGTSALEIALNKQGEKADVYSPLHMAYTQSVREDGTGCILRQNWLNDFGMERFVFGYLTSDKGTKESYLENDEIIDIGDTHYLKDEGIIDPLYEASVKQTAKQFDIENKREASIDSFFYVDTTSKNNIKSIVADYGFVYASMIVNEDYFDDIYVNYYCPDKALAEDGGFGHDVLVIGWDDNYSKDNFKEEERPETDGAWICLNSWGEDEDSDGYIYVSYEDRTLFSEDYSETWTIDKAHKAENGEKLYSLSETNWSLGVNDPYGPDIDEVYYLNRFTFSENEILTDVYFDTESAGAEYQICYAPVKDNKPDLKNIVKLGNKGIVPYVGYIDAKIGKEFIVPEGDGFIGLSLSKKNGSENSMSFTCSCSIETGQDMDLYLMSDIKDNTSFSGIIDGDFTQADDFAVFGQLFMIKARTVSAVPPAPTEYLFGDVDIDGRVGISDATLIQLHLVNLCPFSDLQKTLAMTIENDEKVNINDTTAIQMYLAKLSYSGSKVNQKYIK